MKKLLLYTLLIIVSFTKAEAQGHYEKDFISFDYSSKYKKSEITSAQHMLIKIENDACYFSISEWKYKIPSTVDAWNDEIYNQYKTMPVKDGKLVTIEKRLIDIKGGQVKALFMLSNISVNGVNLKSATCIIVHRGNLYIISHMSQGKYLPFSPCKDFLEILKGLALKSEKSITHSSNQQFRDNANNEEGFWNEKNCTYANFFYGFSWNLEKGLEWSRDIGTELHTVFKAHAKDVPLVVFVHANEYNEKLLNKDIFDKYEEIKELQQTEFTRIAERIGGSYESVAFEKTKLWTKNAIRYVNILRMSSSSLHSNESTYSITYKTLHKGRLFSVNIEMSLALYEFVKKEKIDVEKELLSGFKFTAE